MIIYELFCWVIFLVMQVTNCVNVNILSKESAFMKFSTQSLVQEIIYKQPLEDKLIISAMLSDLKTTKELERSKYKSNVYTDKQSLSIQSNLNKDIFTINSICKFDHDNLAAFALDKVCCEMTLKNKTKVFQRKYCKLEISHTSSACYAQLELMKDNFTFQKHDDYELDIYSRVFSSQDSKCSQDSIVVDNLAVGYPTKLVVTQGLEVKWESTDITDTFGDLEIGIPVDSVEINSKTLFPLRIRSNTLFSNFEITCSFGDDLSLSSISFESTKYEGEFKKPSENLVKLIISRKDNYGDIGDSLEEQIVNLRIRLLSLKPYSTNTLKTPNNWMSCRIEKAKVQKMKTTISRKSSVTTKQVFIKINVDNFIIIPILQKSFLFSILDPIFGPIDINERNLKVFNVHNTRDGSLIDITPKTECKAISNSTLKCPLDKYLDSKRQVIKQPNWNIILTMMNWQKMVSIPIDFWQAEDWRMFVNDNKLNRITNWNYPTKSLQQCKPVYQSTRSQLLARLVKDDSNSDKIYFGQNKSDLYPLLDMTPQLSLKNILISNNNIEILLLNNILFIKAINVGTTDLSIVDNINRKIVFERILIEESSVSILDIDVSCIHSLSINPSIDTDDDLTFRSININSQKSQSSKESCYFKIKLIFDDKTEADLLDYKNTNFRLHLDHSETSVTIDNLENFLYEPYRYKEPGKFVLHLHESTKCSDSKLIIKKEVNIYEKQIPKSRTSPKVLPKILGKSNRTTKQMISTILSSTTLTSIIKVSANTGIDTEKLFLTMKILIGLVLLVVIIIVLNCIIKIRHRKSACLLDRQMAACPIYGQVDKLTTSTYSPVDVANQTPNNQHPPLLPPPGPLYNSSDSSQLDLAVNATPDIFWGLPHPNDKDRNISSNHLLMGIQMNSLNSPSNNSGYPNNYPNSIRTSPSPHSDSIEYNYLNSNGSKMSHPRTLQSAQNGYNYTSNSIHDSDSLASRPGSKTSSQIAVMVPPCPPLRWNNNWNSNQFPVYFPNDKDLNIEPSILQFSNEHSSQNSLAPSHTSSWEIKQPLILPPSGFNSIDNVCEKSSGLGSLTSTQPGSDCSKKESAHTNSPHTTNYSTSH